MFSEVENNLLDQYRIDIENVKNFVNTSLKNKSNGDVLFYDKVVQQLMTRDDPDTLWKLYFAISHSLSTVMRSADLYKELIRAIYSYNWDLDDNRVSISYRHLITKLISSNTVMILPSFQMLIQCFLLVGPKLSSMEANETVLQQARESRRQYIHSTIRSILTLAPTSHSHLFPLLEEYFPHKRFGYAILTEYVSHLLRICQYIPSIQHLVLDLIIRKCLEIDVDIVIEDSGDVRIHEEYQGESLEESEMFAFEDVVEVKSRQITSSSTRTGIKSSTSALENSQQSIPSEVAEIAEKLDSILILLGQYIDASVNASSDIHTNHSSSAITAKDRLYEQLLDIFEERILTTYKSKFVQFVIFYISGKSSQWSSQYAYRLLRIFLDEKLPALKRQAAVLYLASYLSRARYVPSHVVGDVLSDIVTWCGSYVSVLESSTPKTTINRSPRGLTGIKRSFHTDQDIFDIDELGRKVMPDLSIKGSVNRHETFYSAVQASCYICCFHGVEIGLQQKLSTCLNADWIRIFLSYLEPLKYCLYNIRVEFLSLAHSIGLLDQQTWEKLSLESLNHSDTQKSMKDWNSNPLDSFFPFDPCLLRGFHDRIEPYYRHWIGVPGLVHYDGKSLIDDDHQSVIDSDIDTDALTMSRSTSVSHSLSAVDRDTSHMGSLSESYTLAMSYSQSPSIRGHDGVYGSIRSQKDNQEAEDVGNHEGMPIGPDEWPLRGRQPRHYSVGSTGSW